MSKTRTTCRLWVVEIWCPGWEPEEGWSFYNRAAARDQARQARTVSPYDRFRVARYEPWRSRGTR